jgi:hypothetical protein
MTRHESFCTFYDELTRPPISREPACDAHFRCCERASHRAAIEGKFHSRQIWIRENAVYAVGVEDFQTQVHARCHDFRRTCGLKIDGITDLFSRLDDAPGRFALDFISIRDKAAAKFFGKLSKADFIALFDKYLVALVSARRPGSGQIETVRLRSQQEATTKQESV